MSNFKNLGLSQSILEVLDSLGFETPTPVQEKAIPILLKEDPTDFIGLAQTGTGKTAAFGLPLIDLIDENDKSTQALIMAPTRELGQQLAQQLVSFTRNNKKINIEVVYGGANIATQIKALKKPVHILVATPGRLLDLIKRKAVVLDGVSYVVLDEADEMLNMGFKEDIDEILSHTLEERVTWLFSATMPKEIRRIVKKYMTNPKEVSVNLEEKTNKDIDHKFVVTKVTNKVPALRRFLDIQPDMRGVMFCRTKRETQQIAEDLGNMGYGVEALHGDLSQGQRDAVMRRFKSRSMQLLIATDVAARGIDVSDLTHVIHHTLPDQLESYTHRSGRTGRAGKKGVSLALVNPREANRIKEIEKHIGVHFEKIEVPGVEELLSSRISHWAHLIANTKVDTRADELLEQIKDDFAEMSKEDILKRLITSQLDHLIFSNKGGNEDLNESYDGKKSGSSERRGSQNGEFNRYFVNIGSIDGLTKGDLIHLLSDISGVDRQHFGDLNMQKNFSFFEVDKNHDEGLSAKFEEVMIDERDIRVNRDDQKPTRKSSGSSNWKSRPRRDRERPKSGNRTAGKRQRRR